MNLLPFVFTFLLLLSLMSSMMFSSAVRTKRQHEIISAHHDTYLALLSDQHKAAYEQKRERSQSRATQHTQKARPAKKVSGNFRDEQKGAEGSKLHLYTMIHGKDEALRSEIMRLAARLLEELYAEADFYKLAKGQPAELIVQEMVAQKIRRLEDLNIEDADCDRVYYRMLQGTSSSYPPLAEHFAIGKGEEKPVRFRFASSSLMRAALGLAASEKLFELEAKKGEAGGRRGPLTKKEFLDFLRAEAGGEMEGVFDYENKRKGAPQSQRDRKGKMRVMHVTEQ